MRSEIHVDNIDKVNNSVFTEIKDVDSYLEGNDNIIDDENLEVEYDDKGDVYKINGELLENSEYSINGMNYKTNGKGEIVHWEGKPEYTPDAERDNKAQVEVGGDNRLDNDDGGHLNARITGGSGGIENLVPMRDTINRGDYKKMENEIVDALRQNQDVHVEGNIYRENDSTSRPTKIDVRYEYGEVKKELIVDNVEGSENLLDELKGNIKESDYKDFKANIDEMKEDGCEVSITSILKEYDADGNVISYTVGIRNESEKDKSYIIFEKWGN